MIALLDEKDKKIIELLKKNARTSYNDIAKEIGITNVGVIKRIKKLERTGIIKKYTIVVDYRKLGYEKISITGINTKPESMFKVLEELKKKDYVKFLAITSGDHNLIATILAKDSNEMLKIIKEIEAMEGVEKVYPAIILDIVKDEICI